MIAAPGLNGALDRIPPYSREAERAILGAMMRDNRVIPAVRLIVNANAFYQDAHQKVFRAIEEIADSGRPIDLVILTEWLRANGQLEDVGNYDYLAELWASAPTAANAEYFAKTVKEFGKARAAGHLFAELQRDAFDRVCPVDDLLARAEIDIAIIRGEGSAGSSKWPRPLSPEELAVDDSGIDWISYGMIARGHITLASALMKSGKSTFLSCLLRALQDPPTGNSTHLFCDRPVRECRTLVVTEESRRIWDKRCRALGLDGHASFLCRPLFNKPTIAEWSSFVGFIGEQAKALKCEHVVIDTISAFAPWKSENDSAEVQATMTPLNRLTEAGLAVSGFHHFGKVDGIEGRAARGSTALAAAADILLELRRYNPDDKHDRRRVLTGLGRFEEVPDEIVIRLNDDATAYTAEGDRKQTRSREMADAIRDALPGSPPGSTADEIHEDLPAGARPKKGDLRGILKAGAAVGNWQQTGTGKPAAPWRFWRAAE
jgi:hypothetical protein